MFPLCFNSQIVSESLLILRCCLFLLHHTCCPVYAEALSHSSTLTIGFSFHTSMCTPFSTKPSLSPRGLPVCLALGSRSSVCGAHPGAEVVFKTHLSVQWTRMHFNTGHYSCACYCWPVLVRLFNRVAPLGYRGHLLAMWSWVLTTQVIFPFSLGLHRQKQTRKLIKN